MTLLEPHPNWMKLIRSGRLREKKQLEEFKYAVFTQRFFFFFKSCGESESVAITADELEKLGAGGGVAGFAPP